MSITFYRGFEIFFDEEKETFYATKDDRPGYQSKDRVSFGAVKKSIDEFIKENSTFEPFEVMPNPTDDYFSRGAVIKIIGIRKDGRFVYEGKNKTKEQLSDYDDKGYILIKKENEKGLATIAVLESKIDDIRNQIEAEKKKLNIVTLKDIKHKYIQS